MNDRSNFYPANRPTGEADFGPLQRPGDEAAGIEVTEDFERFNQRNDMFSRAFWDERIISKDTESFFASYRMEAMPRKADGFTQKDFALRNAAWSVADDYADRNNGNGVREGFQDPFIARLPPAKDRVEVTSIDEMTAEIKKIAKLFGADLVGICDYDERWLYASRTDAQNFEEKQNILPEGLKNVIVIAHEMNWDLCQSYPSALAGAAVGIGYSGEAKTVLQLSNYIQNLGYEAVASMNDTALVIPYAVKAGLGEYGRNQMVITEEFGPRVRFAKIFTNLPLIHDQPKKFGVREFCNVCSRCADECPPKALPYGPPNSGGENQSAAKGVVKWTANCEKCFGYWAKLKTDCAICLRVCPYNKDFSKWWFRLGRNLAATSLRKLILRLDTKLGLWKRHKPKDWWSSNV